MTKSSFYCLLSLLLFLQTSSGVPQSSDEGVGPDYFEPGVATDNCLCVPFYQCEDGNIVSDGTGLLDARQKPQELLIEETYNPPECGPFHVCCSDPDAVTVKPYEHHCGVRNPNGITGRVLSKNEKGEAQFGEWPWQVAVLSQEGTKFVFMCGGTLIDDQHVLTVAHCVDTFKDDFSNIIARLGEWDTQNEDELLQHEDYNIEEIIIHPQYRANNLYNDIAILKLSKTVEFKPHIDTACLPQDNDDFTGRDCIVTGWGTNAYKSGIFSMIMKEVSVPVIGHKECQDMLRKTRLGRYFKLHGGFMCAGGKEGEDSCKGDGGGPLVCFKNNKSYTVAGLVAWGIDCGQPGVPGVYMDVRKYTDWIASKTGRPVEEYWDNSEK